MNGETVHGLLHTEVVELLLKVKKTTNVTTTTLFSLLVFHLILCYNTSVSDMCLFCRVEVKSRFPQPLLKTLLLKLVQLEEIVTEAKW